VEHVCIVRIECRNNNATIKQRYRKQKHTKRFNIKIATTTTKKKLRYHVPVSNRVA
jgi:hypothetical protein